MQYYDCPAKAPHVQKLCNSPISHDTFEFSIRDKLSEDEEEAEESFRN